MSYSREPVHCGGDGYDPWPYDYAIAGLQWLALSPAALVTALPPPFPTIPFEFGGCVLVSTSMHAWLGVCRSCISPGRCWDEFCLPSEDLPGIKEGFTAIHDMLQTLWPEGDDTTLRTALLANAPLDWVKTLAECRKQATAMLQAIGWYEIENQPLLDLDTLFNEFSYGLYDDAKAGLIAWDTDWFAIWTA
ncbi:hypothetical protein [Andreprevotia lacus]|uniref:hypothetical protein n=1 Tax=Andreprevotia lacus TaxID=1121000 RepID=UPI00111C6640|nr:hypothetical protein [Andreprevotia lacus]